MADKNILNVGRMQTCLFEFKRMTCTVNHCFKAYEGAFHCFVYVGVVHSCYCNCVKANQ